MIGPDKIHYVFLDNNSPGYMPVIQGPEHACYHSRHGSFCFDNSLFISGFVFSVGDARRRGGDPLEAYGTHCVDR